mmetsp:Transcript_7200/g.10936  ORF Transcript_7200/g.10936 Transcript_7200/m.10936 type:complete len:364 (+) Transcript_7200:276-1367(+)|eukprot:CAMPEP_0178917706 /NCGR_PEP_ID=MMETSP0786-20121207/13400_1 /TAXON_ID=186022 /ORGANISM="Thalassionema frauenfeldii, Strain CCMP 1798" /LENGTH=363 /DNA_ID=CAMNT_0020591295 /DNA_START=186 /DNA_END=1277 /DNA_ORIENTATION=-
MSSSGVRKASSREQTVVASPPAKEAVGGCPLKRKRVAAGACNKSDKMLPPPKPIKPSSSGISTLPPPHPRPSSAKRALPGTKKPRGKRTKQFDNRSTITSTTDTIKTPVNVYDAVLGEAEALLQAASEAQALGRLKMASAYQLLLHARLVGLGKRFDRAKVEESDPSIGDFDAGRDGKISARTLSKPETATKLTTPKKIPATPSLPKQQKPNVQELSKLLPEHIELDSAMIEHLARAAMDLHHKRTGRKIQSDLPTPPPASSGKSTVAWTEQEKSQCQELLRQGQSEEEIAQCMKSKSEAQVRSYLQNKKQRQSQAKAVEQVFGDEDTPRKSKGRGRKPPTQAMNTVPNANLDAKTLLSGNVL